MFIPSKEQERNSHSPDAQRMHTFRLAQNIWQTSTFQNFSKEVFLLPHTLAKEEEPKKFYIKAHK